MACSESEDGREWYWDLPLRTQDNAYVGLLVHKGETKAARWVKPYPDPGPVKAAAIYLLPQLVTQPNSSLSEGPTYLHHLQGRGDGPLRGLRCLAGRERASGFPLAARPEPDACWEYHQTGCHLVGRNCRLKSPS